MRGLILAAVLLASLAALPDEASAHRGRRVYGGYSPSVRVYGGPGFYSSYSGGYGGYYGYRPYYSYRPYYYSYRPYYPRTYYYTPGYYYAPLYRSGIHWYW